MMSKLVTKPFRINVPDAVLADIRTRLLNAHLPPAPPAPLASSWQLGASHAFMLKLRAYWLDAYDWRKQEAALNRFPQFTAEIDDHTIHFVHEKGSSTRPRPLLLLHGWPGSHVEFMHAVERLAHPERFGGKAEDGFDVIVPSLPGFGFSSPNTSPTSPRKMAWLMARLMRDVLGYERYIAQGGDWGSLLSGWLAYEAPECAGAHFNFFFWRNFTVQPEGDAEKAWSQRFAAAFEASNAYFKVHVGSPLTLAFGMEDSPMGAASWIIDKFHAWSDIGEGGIEASFTMDQLITNVMTYLVNRAFTSALWYYPGYFLDFGTEPLPPDARITQPVGVASFPKEFLPWPPRSFVERHMNVVRWRDMPSGGHFAMLEKPDLLIPEISGFANDIGF